MNDGSKRSYSYEAKQMNSNTGTHRLRLLEGSVTPLKAQGIVLLVSFHHWNVSFLLWASSTSCRHQNGICFHELHQHHHNHHSHHHYLPGEVSKAGLSSPTGTGTHPVMISRPFPGQHLRHSGWNENDFQAHSLKQKAGKFVYIHYSPPIQAQYLFY